MSTPKSIDCIIVGGGLLGMLSARELSKAGMQVTLLEQGRTGRESSWAGGGILSPLYPWRYAPAVTELASWSQANYPGLVDELIADGCLDPEIVTSGLMILDMDEADIAQQWASQNQRALHLINASERNELAAEYDWTTIPSQQSIWMPDVAQIRNPRLAQSLRESIENCGVTIREQSQVESLIIKDGRIRGVKGQFGEVLSNTVVIAGGAWSQQFLPAGRFEMLVKPVKGQMVLFKAEPGVVNHIYLYKDRYLIPRRDGHVLIGSTLEDTGFDKTTTEAAHEELIAVAHAMVPALQAYPVVKHWAGLRPGSPDGVPYITQHPEINGLFFNAGHYRNGVVLGYASARLLADLMLNRTPIVSPAPYRLCEESLKNIDFV
jgi:glycine oxidase